MIHSLYQLINKGSFRTLSFILALGLTAVFSLILIIFQHCYEMILLGGF